MRKFLAVACVLVSGCAVQAPTSQMVPANPCQPMTSRSWTGAVVTLPLSPEREAACQKRIADDAEAKRVRDERARQAKAAYEAAEEARASQAKKIDPTSEESPDNTCKSPDIARLVLAGFNRLGRSHYGYNSRRAVDITHMRTLYYKDYTDMACHGSFQLTTGASVTGTMVFRPNIANDLMFEWKAD
jgi:hypothetical protein